MVLEGYVDEGNSYKLHIAFNDDCSASASFWIPLKDNQEGYECITRKLEAIGMKDDFERSKNNVGYVKVYRISEEHPTLEDVDKAIADFVIKLNDKLNSKPQLL
jgi:hypothetical protein